MIELDKATAGWEKTSDGWLIAPAGLDWIEEGCWLKVGTGCTLGNGCTLGDECRLGHWCTLGNECTLGDECRLGHWCTLGDRCTLGDECRLGHWCTLGDRCTLGNGCTLGNECTLGNGCTLGRNASDPIDIGFADGYRKCIAEVDGAAYIGAGCRWFTVTKAIKHWSGKPDRVLTMCLMAAARQIATTKGWRIE